MTRPLILNHFQLAYSKILEQAGETFQYLPAGKEEGGFELLGVRELLPLASAGSASKRTFGRVFQITFLTEAFERFSKKPPQEGDALKDESGQTLQVVSLQGRFRFEFADPMKAGMRIVVREV